MTTETTNHIELLRRLAERWRASEGGPYAFVAKQCADELEAALAQQPAAEPVSNPDKLLAAAERCESAAPECGPVAHHDSDGVPLCQDCWDALPADGAA